MIILPRSNPPRGVSQSVCHCQQPPPQAVDIIRTEAISDRSLLYTNIQT